MTEPSGTIKCVVWDLDNTLWDGVLLEDDPVTLRPDARRVIETLDQRGILQSIASRNEFDSAMQKLRQFGLHEHRPVAQHWSRRGRLRR
ncbi:MAG: HAD-IIIC family phosphatase [Planctomycetota bacterium]